jgi:hypothetical protein
MPYLGEYDIMSRRRRLSRPAHVQVLNQSLHTSDLGLVPRRAVPSRFQLHAAAPETACQTWQFWAGLF